MNLNDAVFNDNKVENRYELHVKGEAAIIRYSDEGDKVVLIHTEVPEFLEGNGIAAALVEKTLEHLQNEQKKIVPACSYIRNFLRTHSEWTWIVA